MNVSDFGLPNTRRQSCKHTLSRTAPEPNKMPLLAFTRDVRLCDKLRYQAPGVTRNHIENDVITTAQGREIKILPTLTTEK